MLELRIRILGTSPARPYPGRATSAIYVSRGGTRILVDCGEGTLAQLEACGHSPARLSAVCITHLHGDHCYGLPGLLTSMALGARTKTLYLVGPSTLRAYVESALRTSYAALTYAIEYIEVPTSAPQREALNLRDLSIATVPLRHRVPAVGYHIEGTTIGLRLRPGVVEKYSIPYAAIPKIRAGEDLETDSGTHLANRDLTLPAAPPPSVAYLTDTAVLAGYPTGFPSPTVLLHDSTFAGYDADLADKTGHATSLQAAAFAKTVQPGLLLLTHISPRYAEPEVLARDARGVFVRTALAVQGAEYIC